MKGVAVEYLSPLQVAQLQATRPDLHLGVQQCQRCHNGQVVSGECLQCSAEHDEDGQLLGEVSPEEIKALYGNAGQHHKIYR